MSLILIKVSINLASVFRRINSSVIKRCFAAKVGFLMFSLLSLRS